MKKIFFMLVVSLIAFSSFASENTLEANFTYEGALVLTSPNVKYRAVSITGMLHYLDADTQINYYCGFTNIQFKPAMVDGVEVEPSSFTPGERMLCKLHAEPTYGENLQPKTAWVNFQNNLDDEENVKFTIKVDQGKGKKPLVVPFLKPRGRKSLD